MNDEIKKALAATRATSLADAFGGALHSGSRGGRYQLARLADGARREISAAPLRSFVSLAAQAQRFTAVDAQLRKLSEQISARAREPQMVEFMANIDGMSSIAARFADSSIAKQFAASQRVADSSIAKLLSPAQTEISGSGRLLATIERFRESFVAKATIPSSFTRALDEMARSSRGALSVADSSIASFAAVHEASARSISRIAAEARAFDTQAMERLTQSFESAGKLALTRELPASFASVFAEASAGAKYLDSIRLPLIDR